MLNYNIECVVCGKFFRPRNKRHLCCSKECSKNRDRKLSATREYSRRSIKHKKKDLMKQLTKDAIAADMLGISYGQYKGQQYIRNKLNSGKSKEVV